MDPFTGNAGSSTEEGAPPSLEDVLADFGMDQASKKADFITSRQRIFGSLKSQQQMEDLEAIDDIELGNKCESMVLYNHDPDSNDRNIKWSEFEDAAEEEKRVKELGKAFVIIHRRSKVEKDGNETWITHSIEAQSNKLRILLSAIFSDYPGWYPDSAPFSVKPPFKPYVHRWDTIVELSERQNLSVAKELQLLRRELELPIASHLAALEKVKKTGTISFEQLWLILAPGCLVVSNEGGHTCVSSLLKVDFTPAQLGCPAMWTLKLVRVNWNGSFTGLEAAAESIPEYKDEVLISNLPVYPIEFLRDRKKLEERLLARGRKFESLRGFHIKSCTGKKYVRGTFKEDEKPVSGRIIVDAYAYHKVQNEVPPVLTRLARSSEHPGSLSEIHGMISESEDSDDSESILLRRVVLRRGGHKSDRVYTVSRKGKKVDKAPPNDQDKNPRRKEDIIPLTDLECILTVPRVKGFDMSVKEWCEFNVDDIGDTDWDETPYNNLVLPEGEKELVMAFADHPRLGTQGFDDFIAHKGEGIIILLCGPPGVGKTLTAEAMAEKSRVPLYVLSASDLGTSPEKVEAGLTKALECCQLWDAILLLDEADVFLEARDCNSLDRNELVSIFLRRLEYYQGIMFLTTNRLSVIDPAFKSRLDLILPYHDLDEPSRRKVWVNFIQKLGPELRTSISDQEFDGFAKEQLNGREIKNSIKTALVLASRDGPFRAKHLNTVLNIRKRVANMESAEGTGESEGNRRLKRARRS